MPKIPWAVDSAEVVSSESNSVNGIPLVNGVKGEERFTLESNHKTTSMLKIWTILSIKDLDNFN